MVAKRGLGKGLDSMIPEKVEKKSNTEKKIDNVSRETFVSINLIEPNATQPRKKFDEDALHELAESIKQFGIIQPLVVQKRNKYYEIIAGERRWRAAKLAGLKELPVIVKDYSDKEIVEISIIENIQREDLNPIEEAMAYQRLLKEFQLKQDEIAERVCKSRTAVTNSMRLLKLSDKVKQLLIDDIISGGHGRALLPIDDEELQYTVALKILDENMSVRETEKFVKTLLTPKPEKLKKQDEKSSIIYRGLEEKMKAVMGTKVSINQKNDEKGMIQIEYYSKEEFERVVDMIMAIEN
ncbi:MAG: ParB family transcriptional regulator, chromosome partitioning protein [Clostridiales bacterium]|nr:ParB family transcriptional regulator, chromosome partitioning protein [Clostridiales bacterium]